MNTCYLCGSSENLTKDHIPPKNLFPSPRPSNLITVLCCQTCNGKFTLLDESFRVWVSSTINRSKAGQWIWNNKVMNSTFKRSPKLKSAVRNSLIPMMTQLNGQTLQTTGMTYPIRKARKYLIRLTMGFTRHFNPNIDYSKAKFRVKQMTPNQQLIDMLYKKFFYIERGDGIFKMWRMFVKGAEPLSYWVYVFYDDLMFRVEMK